MGYRDRYTTKVDSSIAIQKSLANEQQRNLDENKDKGLTKIPEGALKSPSLLDDILIDYQASDDDNHEYIAYNFKETGINLDIKKIYEALDKISIENPEHSDLIDKITETDNWMYTSDTPKEWGKHHNLGAGVGRTGANTPVAIDYSKYKSWTAANAFGVGIADFTDSDYFAKYNDTLEEEYDKLLKEENPWGPNFLISSKMVDENIISPWIEHRYGPEAWMKADAIASDKAKTDQLAKIKELANDKPSGNKMNSLLKALSYIQEHNELNLNE